MLTRQRTGLSAQVHDYVKQQLLDGEIAIGSAIPIDAIAARLGISRQPVMDAVRRLAQDGFVDVVPQVGSFPRTYRVREIVDFFRLFAESEAVVAALAAERRDPAGIARLRQISAEIGALRGADLPEPELARTYRKLNRRFHSEIRAMMDSSAVAEVVETMGDQSDFLASAARAPIFMKRLDAAIDEHEQIIAAIESGDAARAARLMRQHVLAIADRIVASASEPATAR
ncbi:MAG TPA: GntR family transcriptional regulator [Novosphingobium sp.]